MNRITHTCKNITLATTSLRPVMISQSRYNELRRSLLPDNDDVEEDKEQLGLKYICREAIRKHLLGLDPHLNLFDTIDQLPLPSIVKEYLLFDVSLDSTINN